ncbi:MAG: amidohydrolase family protein [archaeon]|jgi:dihydroorotase
MRIDPHVHFRDEEQSYKETIAHGLKVAKEQGVNIVFDMPNTARPVIAEEDVKRRLALVPKGEEERYFTYIGATNNPSQLKSAVELVKNNERVCGIKMFAGKSVGNLEITGEDDQKNVYSTLAEVGYAGVLAVHCEKESFMKNYFDPQNPFTHTLARPKEAEIESAKDQIKFASEAKFKGNLHICHSSCIETINLVTQAKEKGDIKITCGVTPHHLLWCDEKMKESSGLLFKMNPPLRSQSDVSALQEALKEGKIDWIETDHAPHSVGEKLSPNSPSGYPSLYLYKDFVEKFLPSLGITNKQIEIMTYRNIVKTFGLKI